MPEERPHVVAEERGPGLGLTLAQIVEYRQGRVRAGRHVGLKGKARVMELDREFAADDMNVVAAVPDGLLRVGGRRTGSTYTDEEHSCSTNGRGLS